MPGDFRVYSLCCGGVPGKRLRATTEAGKFGKQSLEPQCGAEVGVKDEVKLGQKGQCHCVANKVTGILLLEFSETHQDIRQTCSEKETLGGREGKLEVVCHGGQDRLRTFI